MKRKKLILKQIKLARGCYLVVCTFGLCYLPLMVLLQTLDFPDKETVEIFLS